MIIRVNAKLECASEGQTIGQMLISAKYSYFGIYRQNVWDLLLQTFLEHSFNSF